jgi:hypothetical protein
MVTGGDPDETWIAEPLHQPPATAAEEIRPTPKESDAMKQLTEDEFDAQFTVLEGPDGESIRDGHDGIEPDSRHLWTIVDADGSLYAVSGLHYVNRIGYLVTEEPWTEDTEAVWFLAEDDDEEDGEG